MCQCPAVEFSEGDTQLRSLHQCQVCRVATVQDVHQSHLIVEPLQNRPNNLQYNETHHSTIQL